MNDASTSDGAAREQALSAELAEAHAAVRADEDIQFDLPAYEIEPPVVPEWLKALLQSLEALGPAVPYILGAVVIGLLAYFLWPVLNAWLAERRHRGRPDLPDWRPEQKTARVLLGEADALAAEGRYAEAAHLLLHRSIDDIQAARPHLVRIGFTSREIAAHREMPEDARGVFAPIAELVERGRFAGRAVVEADWLGARSAYDRFVFARPA